MYCDLPVCVRCCFCMPLRKGILTFGYVNLFLCAFMVGVHSYAVHTDFEVYTVYHGTYLRAPAGMCVAIYCTELVFCALLIYGIHQKLLSYIKAYYYFSITTIVAAMTVQLIDMFSVRHRLYLAIDIGPLMFAALCIQLYLILLIRSLIRKMEVSDSHVYENPLQQIVYDGKVEANGVYNETTVVPV